MSASTAAPILSSSAAQDNFTSTVVVDTLLAATTEATPPSENDIVEAEEEEQQEERHIITTSVSSDSSHTSTTSSSLLAQEQSLPASSSQQRAPRQVLPKRAKSFVSRFLPRQSAGSSSYSVNSGSSRSSRGALQRSRSSNLSSRFVSISAPTMIPGSLMVYKSSPQVAPLLKPCSTNNVDAGQASSWSRFRRQSTASTVTSLSFISHQNSSIKRLETTERDDDEDENVVFHKTSLRVKNEDYENMNVLQWLTIACPTDVLPHILAYCGPQMTMRMHGVNRFWAETVRQESTWRIMCQDLYKWKPGAEEPESWKDYYRENPCVPIDYKTIPSALEANQGENIRVFLRPGRYYIKETIKVDRTPAHKVSVESMTLPTNTFQAPPELIATNTSPVDSDGDQQRKKRRGKGLLKFILCTGAAYNNAAIDEDDEQSEDSENDSAMVQMPRLPTRATIVLRTRRMNEPVIRVQRGQFSAQNLNIEHSSHGLDIWNGNAAIQIQPPQQDQEGPPSELPQNELPVANLRGLRVTSRSGRGIVTIDGGQLVMNDSHVYECAATGVYIGGRGTRATVTTSDVVRNGLGSRGNARRSGGIARNHSGIYLEQGVAEILDCNVSNNTLTGITAVSTDNATLVLRDSDLMGNGTFQLEIPSRNARGITMQQNRLEASGTGRTRAALEN
ncbi:hypothetical protein ACA910_001510 [Epithemia clementina (nom. ined.)]